MNLSWKYLLAIFGFAIAFPATAVGTQLVWNSDFDSKRPSITYGFADNADEPIILLDCGNFQNLRISIVEMGLPEDFLKDGNLTFFIDTIPFEVRADAYYSDYMGTYIPVVSADPSSDKWLDAFLTGSSADIFLDGDRKVGFKDIDLRDLKPRAAELIRLCAAK